MNDVGWFVIGMIVGYTLGVLNFGIGIIHENEINILAGSILIGLGIMNNALFIFVIAKQFDIKVIK